MSGIEDIPDSKFPFSEALHLSLENIKKRFVRTLITTLGIILGIARGPRRSCSSPATAARHARAKSNTGRCGIGARLVSTCNMLTIWN